jgi:hypothetical protein
VEEDLADGEGRCHRDEDRRKLASLVVSHTAMLAANEIERPADDRDWNAHPDEGFLQARGHWASSVGAFSGQRFPEHRVFSD